MTTFPAATGYRGLTVIMKAALLRPFRPAAPVLPLLCGFWLCAAGALPAQDQQTAQTQPPAPSQTTTPPPLPEALKSALRTGLFEEEANRDFDKAITAYRAALELYDEQRAGAATVLYRLAECLRKNNQPAEAVPLYRRVLAEFPAETDLCADARRRLAELVPGEPADPNAPPPMTREEANLLADLRVLAERNPEMLEKRQRDFQAAAGDGWLQVVRFLTERKVPGLDFSTALNAAAKSGHVPVVDYLLTHGADAKKDGGTALVVAILSNRAAVVYKLIDTGADLNTGAVKSGEERYENPNDYVQSYAPDSSKAPPVIQRPLALALDRMDEALARYLMEKGARCDQPSETKESKSKFPLHVAWNADLARFLLEHGANLEARDDEGLSPLLAHASIRNYDVVEALIAAGADLTAKDSADGTLIYHLTKSVSADSAFTDSPLQYKSSLPDKIELLAKEEARLAARREQVVRILDAAIKGGVPVNGLVKQFRRPITPQAHADTVGRNLGPRSPAAGHTEALPVLALACEWMKTPAQAAFLEELIKRGAEVNFADSHGITPLHTAALRRNGPLLEVLLKHEANPLAETTVAIVPQLWMAALLNSPQMGWNAQVNDPDFFRYRPMHLTGAQPGGAEDREAILLLARATHAEDFEERNSGIWHDYSPLALPYEARIGLNNTPPVYKIADPAFDGKVPVTLVEAVMRAYPGLGDDASPEIHILRRRPDNDLEAEDIMFDLNTLTAAESPAIPELKPGDILLLLPHSVEKQPGGSEVTKPLPQNLAFYLEEKQALNVTVAAPERAPELGGKWRICRPLLNSRDLRMDVARRTVWSDRSLSEVSRFFNFRDQQLTLHRITRIDGEPVLEVTQEPPVTGLIYLRDGDTLEFEEAPPPQNPGRPGVQMAPPATARPFIPAQPGRRRTVLPTQ